MQSYNFVHWRTLSEFDWTSVHRWEKIAPNLPGRDSKFRYIDMRLVVPALDMEDQVSNQTRYLGMLVVYVGKKPKFLGRVTNYNMVIITNGMIVYPEDRNCRFIGCMFVVDNLTTSVAACYLTICSPTPKTSTRILEYYFTTYSSDMSSCSLT